jgi:hypothetical protein
MPRKQTIADLVRDGRLERIQGDTTEARDLLEHASKHLASAIAIVDDDPAGAYQLVYDAARKATAADMAANGYRAKSDRPGAHAAVVAYAEEALAGDAEPTALANFDQMRRSRNRSEYGGVTLSAAQVKADLESARAIVDGVRKRGGAW